MSINYRKKKPITEVFFAAGFLVIINLFFPAFPGFSGTPVNPYLLLAVLAGIYYGQNGALALSSAWAIMAGVIMPLILALTGIRAFTWESWFTFLLSSGDDLAAILVVSFAVSLARDHLLPMNEEEGLEAKDKDDYRKRLEVQVKALRTVNEELDERLSREADTLLTLQAYIQRLFTLDFNTVISETLSIVRRYTGARSCTIWQYQSDRDRIVLVRASSPSVTLTVIPVEGSIEGWVARNNRMFSVRLLLENDALSRYDISRNIITAPLHAGRMLWGVLNIEDLPFEKYNLYTEGLLNLILTLVSPALDQALSFEGVILHEDINPITKFPAYGQFLKYLEREIESAQTNQQQVSLFIIELANHGLALSDEFEDETEREHLGETDAVWEFFSQLAQGISDSIGNQVRFFHYKQNNQISLITPGVDTDGASMISLEILGQATSREWNYKDKEFHPELYIGFASSRDWSSGDAMRKAAEHLLMVQKL